MTAAEREHIRRERSRILREKLFSTYFDERDGVTRTRRGATGRRSRGDDQVDAVFWMPLASLAPRRPSIARAEIDYSGSPE